MYGALLETNARKIKNEGRAEGHAEGRTEGKIEVFLNLIADGIPKDKAQRLVEIDDSLAEKALKSRSINQSFPQAASKLNATCFLSVSTQ